MKMSWKTVSGIVGATVAGFVLMLSATFLAYPAISQLAGLAVAQTATQWNNVIDAARGDAQQSGILGTSTYLFNGLTFDRIRGDITNGMDVDVTRISGAITPADAFANPTTANTMWSLNGIFNGTTWDRMRSATADALASTGIVAVGNMVFNGATFDRMDGISATNNTATTSTGALQTTQLSTWRVTDTDVGATQSIASRAAGGGTVRHVATAVSACMSATVAQVPILVNLRDGATGAGTIIRSWTIGVSAVNGSSCISDPGLNETGTANTAMTMEFAAAGAATTTTTVNISGYSTP